ncbi:hypothetical protein [Helicobacter sp. 13S00477-4]|uniref:hypothetical protein n=1 Tax=Helicobacter sp. 13S00477-4 TaxID=1905759 RepID=UPI000BA5B839|nr:hypothetical protein [Helicobacter sp. 13S00477-4]PAF50648.1 hypothetical protein BKH44_07335 [Helicobacter sp. 13S00477-4]
MKYFIFIALLALNQILWAYKDFGVVGNTYDIQEEDLLIQIRNAAKNTNTKELKQQMEESVRRAMIGKISLPFCQKNTETKRDIFNNQKAAFDIDIPEADVHIKAGTPMSSFYNGEYLHYGLINVNSPHELLWLKGQNGNLNVLVSEGDLLKLKNYPQKYLLNDRLKDSFNLKCTPTTFEIKDGYLIIHEYKIDRKKEVEE